jgi:hypothetical protein
MTDLIRFIISSVSNDSLIEFLLFKGERSGGGTQLGSVSVPVQELVSRRTNAHGKPYCYFQSVAELNISHTEIGPLPLTAPGTQTTPPPSISFKLFQHDTHERSDAVVRTPIIIDQMRENIDAIASFSSSSAKQRLAN